MVVIHAGILHTMHTRILACIHPLTLPMMRVSILPQARNVDTRTWIVVPRTRVVGALVVVKIHELMHILAIMGVSTHTHTHTHIHTPLLRRTYGGRTRAPLQERERERERERAMHAHVVTGEAGSDPVAGWCLCRAGCGCVWNLM